MVMFTFSIFDRNYPFWTNLVQKNKTQFKVKFWDMYNSNMQNSMVMFTFSIFDRNYPFWTNLIQ